MKVFFVVHGAVQGVGYRNLVKNIANRHEVKGMVRNVRDGSVEIFAEAERDRLVLFEKDINVSVANGPQVFNIVKYVEEDSEFPREEVTYDRFIIGKTR